MPLSPKLFYLANVGSFILLTVIIVSYSLSIVPLIIGISLIIFNFYSIVKHLNREPSKNRFESSYLKPPIRSKYNRDGNLSSFETKVQ